MIEMYKISQALQNTHTISIHIISNDTEGVNTKIP